MLLFVETQKVRCKIKCCEDRMSTSWELVYTILIFSRAVGGEGG